MRATISLVAVGAVAATAFVLSVYLVLAHCWKRYRARLDAAERVLRSRGLTPRNVQSIAKAVNDLKDAIKKLETQAVALNQAAGTPDHWSSWLPDIAEALSRDVAKLNEKLEGVLTVKLETRPECGGAVPPSTSQS